MSNKCNICYGHGFWAWGDIIPMGSMDATDGMPTMECPECKSSTNAIKETDNIRIAKRRQLLHEYYKKGLLKQE